jgi:hypothetical protein
MLSLRSEKMPTAIDDANLYEKPTNQGREIWLQNKNIAKAIEATVRTTCDSPKVDVTDVHSRAPGEESVIALETRGAYTMNYQVVDAR